MLDEGDRRVTCRARRKAVSAGRRKLRVSKVSGSKLCYDAAVCKNRSTRCARHCLVKPKREPGGEPINLTIRSEPAALDTGTRGSRKGFAAVPGQSDCLIGELISYTPDGGSAFLTPPTEAPLFQRSGLAGGQAIGCPSYRVARTRRHQGRARHRMLGVQ